MKNYARQYRARLRDWYNKLKDKPCTDCKLKWPPYVMQFDHLPEFTKTEEVGKMVIDNWPKEKIIDEISKCELVCGNCHSIRTFERKMIK